MLPSSTFLSLLLILPPASFAENQDVLKVLQPGAKNTKWKQIRSLRQYPTTSFLQPFDEVSNKPLQDNSKIRSTLSASNDCVFCPQKSSCITSHTKAEGYHPHPTMDGSYFKCQCREGYAGDGWRCHDINECLEDDWPCPRAEDGGFCVDKDPDDEEFPRYKCGCRSGFEAWLSGDHGAIICIPEGTASTYVDDPSTQPSRSPVPTMSQAPSPSPSMAGGCNLCPSQALCTESSAGTPYAFQSDTDDGKYIRCKCKEGYSGDGFRCTDIDECALDNPPCPSEEEGGYCVDRDPDDSQFPLYKCGCLSGFEISSSDDHGATGCRLLTASPSLSVNPSASPAPTPILENRQEEAFFNVKGDTTDEILEEKNLIELSFGEAYEEVDPNECSCRSITNITLVGIVTQDDFVNASNALGSRVLQQSSDLFNTTNSTGSGLFDFSLYFSFVFRCLSCPIDFFLTNDASRRLRGGRVLDTVWPGLSPEDMAVKFGEKLIENGVTSIKEVLSVAGGSTLYNEYLSIEAPTPIPTPGVIPTFLPTHSPAQDLSTLFPTPDPTTPTPSASQISPAPVSNTYMPIDTDIVPATLNQAAPDTTPENAIEPAPTTLNLATPTLLASQISTAPVLNTFMPIYTDIVPATLDQAAPDTTPENAIEPAPTCQKSLCCKTSTQETVCRGTCNGNDVTAGQC